MKFLRNIRETPTDLEHSHLLALLAYQETASATPTIVTIADEVPTRFLENLVSSTCHILEEKHSLIPMPVVMSSSLTWFTLSSGDV